MKNAEIFYPFPRAPGCRCGCSKISLRIYEGQIDRLIDLIQAAERAGVGSWRAHSLEQAAKKYFRLVEITETKEIEA